MTNQANNSSIDTPIKRIYLSRTNKKIFGVCGGIGEYFDIDPSLVRIAWIIMTILTGFMPGIVAYIVVAIVVPQEGTPA